ncbi:MAG: hypothetical protein AMJ63_11700, partial [Myxococcales bacterium SG8_38_1]
MRIISSLLVALALVLGASLVGVPMVQADRHEDVKATAKKEADGAKKDAKEKSEQAEDKAKEAKDKAKSDAEAQKAKAEA